jgi:hypothetical protein
MDNLNQQAHAARRDSVDQIANHFKFPFLVVAILLVTVLSLSLSQASRASSSHKKGEPAAQAAACGVSPDLVEKIRNASRSGLSFTEAASSRGTEPSCSLTLVRVGGLIAGPDEHALAKVMDDEARIAVTRKYGALVYGALNQCYLQPERDAIKESFRRDQLMYIFADRPSLLETGQKNPVHTGVFTGYAESASINPADCSDALIAAGKAIKTMSRLAKERADQNAVKEGGLIASGK